jgi:hypothetical protein
MGGLMVRFRRRRTNLGTYRHPPIIPLSPIERVVEEGVLVSASAVRMALKNRIIVATLRDHLNYDPRVLADAARDEFGALARENDDTAERLEESWQAEGPDAEDTSGEDEYESLRNEDWRRRPGVHRLLAVAFRNEVDNASAMMGLVDQARVDAGEEVGRAISARLQSRNFGSEPDYQEMRSARIRQLIEIDIAAFDGPAPLPTHSPKPTVKRRAWWRLS